MSICLSLFAPGNSILISNAIFHKKLKDKKWNLHLAICLLFKKLYVKLVHHCQIDNTIILRDFLLILLVYKRIIERAVFICTAPPPLPPLSSLSKIIIFQ